MENTPHGTLRACPTCKQSDADWQTKLVEAANGGSTYGVGKSAFA
jgi:hypothetical protein